MRVGGDGAGAGCRGSPTPGPGSAALGAGRRREGVQGARPGAGRNAVREGARWGRGRAREDRGNVEPQLGSWRRAVLGDVTALESEECRAAGAPSAGPGRVAHF